MDSAKKYWPQIIGLTAAAALVIYLITKQSKAAKTPSGKDNKVLENLFKDILDPRAGKSYRE